MNKYEIVFNRGGDICVETVEANNVTEAELKFIMTHGAECSIEEVRMVI